MANTPVATDLNSGVALSPATIGSMDKPFHLLTAAEKTALRIAQNQAITEKIAASKTVQKPQRTPATSSGEGTRSHTRRARQVGQRGHP